MTEQSAQVFKAMHVDAIERLKNSDVPICNYAATCIANLEEKVRLYEIAIRATSFIITCSSSGVKYIASSLQEDAPLDWYFNEDDYKTMIRYRESMEVES